MAKTTKSVAKKTAAKKATTPRSKTSPKRAASAADVAAARTGTKAPADSSTPATDDQFLASTLAQPALMGVGGTGDIQSATSRQISRAEAAVAERNRIAAAKQAEFDENARREEQTRVDRVNAERADSGALRAPVDPAKAQGISPDVTSAVNVTSLGELPVPGTGVAHPDDLAPGQSMAPSPPQSSSNIVPNPDKPGTHFSKM